MLFQFADDFVHMPLQNIQWFCRGGIIAFLQACSRLAARVCGRLHKRAACGLERMSGPFEERPVAMNQSVSHFVIFIGASQNAWATNIQRFGIISRSS